MNWATFQHKLHRFSRWFWVGHLAVFLALSIGFTSLIWSDHAYGAWGDDSPGYTFLAGRLLNGEPLVYQDPLVQAGLDFFGVERQARWLTPTHHEIISPDGWMASIYPIGLSVLQWLAAKVWGTDVAFYGVVPVSAGLVLGLTYVLGILLMPGVRWRVPVALAGSVALAFSSLFFEHALAQPMREIPSMVFLLLGAIGALVSFRARSRVKQWWLVGWVFTGLAFGMATNIRETSVVVIPAILGLMIGRKRSRGLQGLLKSLWKPLTAFVVGFLLIYSISIWNSVEISQHKVKFRKKDITSVAVTSNIDHISSLSFQNVFNNQGKFSTGEGSLPHYWEVMRKATPVVFLFPAILLGLWSIWKTDKRRALLLTLWPLGTLAVFSLWVNPYARYILPAFPPLLLLTFIGVKFFFQRIIPRATQVKFFQWGFGALTALAILIPFGQTIATEWTNLRTNDLLIFKSISAADLQQLKELGEKTTGPNPVVLFTGEWQYGISETFEIHTGIQSIRFPLENKRFDIPADQLAEFISLMLEDGGVQPEGYTLYVWTDETTNSATQQFLTRFKRTNVDSFTSSYAEQIRVDRLD